MGCYRTIPVVVKVPPGATETDVEALITEATKDDHFGKIEVIRLCSPESRPELLCALMQTPPPPEPLTRQPASRNDPCPCSSGKKFKRCCKER